MSLAAQINSLATRVATEFNTLRGSLAKVATSGSYSDLTNTPSIPDMSNAPEITQARDAADTTPRWVTNLTGTLTSTVQNIVENYVSMQAGVTVPSFLASWHNEWGALRGTSPYTWGDSLLRAIRSTGDGITAGNFAELSDRTVSPNLIRWGRRWTDGNLVRNGSLVREVYVWMTGDADPTSGGTVALPSNVTYLLILANADTVPSWAPPGRTFIFRF